MNDYSHFAEDANRWEQTTEAMWGSHDICPLLSQFNIMVISQSCLLAISWAKAWGDPRKPKLGMAYLLLVLAQRVEEERDIWTGGHVGSSLSNSPCLTRRSSKEIHPPHQHRRWLALHFCAVVWGFSTHPPLWHRTHQCHGRWCTNQEHLQMPQLPGGLQASPMQQESGIPRGLEAGFEPIWVPLPKTVSLWCGVYQWTCYFTNKSPQHHPWRHDNGHLPHTLLQSAEVTQSLDSAWGKR